MKDEVSEETDEDVTVCHLATDADEQEGGAQSSACQSVPQCGTEALAMGGVQRNHLLRHGGYRCARCQRGGAVSQVCGTGIKATVFLRGRSWATVSIQ